MLLKLKHRIKWMTKNIADIKIRYKIISKFANNEVVTSYPTILAQKNQQKKQHKNQKQTLTHAYKKSEKEK